jgi:hypothetical protein
VLEDDDAAGDGLSGPFVLPSRTDPIAAAAAAVIGGPAGERMRVGARRFGPGGGLTWIVAVLALLAGCVLGLGVLQKQHCRSDGWNTPDQFWHACYSDTAVLHGSSGLGRANGPSVVDAVGPDGLGQPPLAAAAMWVVSRLAPGEGPTATRQFFDLSAITLAAALAVAVACVAAAAGRRPWDAAHLALAPILVTVGLVSYDLLAVALTAGSILAWSRHREILGGLLIGLAISTRPALAAVVVAVLALSIRTGSWRSAGRYALPAAGTWIGLRLLLLPGLTGGVLEAYRTWRLSGPGYGSIWLIPHLAGQSEPAAFKQSSILSRLWYSGGGMSPWATTFCVLIALTTVVVATFVLALSTANRPRLVHLALFAVAGCLIVTKSVPVQASVILLPLVALAGFRWRDHFIWAGTEVAYFVGVWLYIAASSDANKGLPAGAYLIFLVARLCGIAWLMVLSVRAMREPLADPVRIPPDGSIGADDPQGGVLDTAPDALVVRLV